MLFLFRCPQSGFLECCTYYCTYSLQIRVKLNAGKARGQQVAYAIPKTTKRRFPVILPGGSYLLQVRARWNAGKGIAGASGGMRYSQLFHVPYFDAQIKNFCSDPGFFFF